MTVGSVHPTSRDDAFSKKRTYETYHAGDGHAPFVQPYHLPHGENGRYAHEWGGSKHAYPVARPHYVRRYDHSHDRADHYGSGGGSGGRSSSSSSSDTKYYQDKRQRF